ncbi:FixJ family two-component response regulator [Rhizobium leguminosarum]|uniref:FixJ family two-component response regulator n=1 Tax=Rhizobium leguminosarum TaxID=384 RepID=A0AAE2MI28_RHILE|nr:MULTISPECIES: response regulator transcription factor [Rhizobium]MBB4289579.1 FixJ family two-component response regulator [Rhizobium leguminosarum]MBB4296223.1 FixJ family two-component response regulator [Rhizobium leguminosarum]MBB4308517.1 FixJ family two-component response regulator [Rhizobium leguminosarum]MBB4416353.1 FixJ family two-component response regulator [Rhizobium leguminosarum]MBB4430680.1 FixJ family two-component response regulator [Rhizobium esperanzae]
MSRTSAIKKDAPYTGPVVHVIDDDEAMRLALDCLFRSVGHRVRLFANAADFLKECSASCAGCLVLDVRLPGMNGLDFQAHLAGTGHTLPIVFMTGHGDIPMTVRGMKAGAIDFLPKPFREQDMLDAVAAALEVDGTQRARRDEFAVLRERVATLTPREHEVVSQVSKGQMNKQIAYSLGLSEITVKIHRANAMRKLGMRNLTDLVRFSEALKRQPRQDHADATFAMMGAA